MALSDPEGKIAFPHGFLVYVSLEKLLQEINQLCAEQNIEKIVVGLPVHVAGKQGGQALKTHAFIDQLQEKLPDVPVELVDERFTTQWASDKLSRAGVKARQQKGERDAVAAQILLQTYLDGLKE